MIRFAYRNGLVFVGAVLFAFLIPRCTMNHAGGTGVGNPSGNTSVSIIADTLTSSSRAMAHNGYRSVSGISLPIEDDYFVFNAEKVMIVVQKINFILDDDQDIDSLKPNFAHTFTFEGDSVILVGPFVFDALTGACNVAFDTVTLPPAAYKGIKFDIANNDTTFLDGYSIMLAGNFEYEGAIHQFAINLSNEKDIVPYLLDGPAEYIGEDDSTEFQLTLLANRWLDNIDLKTDYIDEGSITFMPVTGNLVIDRTIDANVYRDFNKIVRLNIIKSGTLTLKSLR